MSTTDTAEDLIRSSNGCTFSLKQAFEFMERIDTMPTSFNVSIGWKDKNGNPVTIGVNKATP